MIVFVVQVAVQLRQFVFAVAAIVVEVAGFVLPGVAPTVLPNNTELPHHDFDGLGPKLIKL